MSKRLRSYARGRLAPVMIGGLLAATITATGCSGGGVDVKYTRVGNQPKGVAVTPSAVWVANNADATFSKLDPGNGKIIDPKVQAPDRPGWLAAEDGSLWVVTFGGAVFKIDPASGKPQKPAVSGSTGFPADIAVGYGSVWVTSQGRGRTGPANAVFRIDAKTGKVTSAIRVGFYPRGIALGAGGVWVANMADRTVSRIDPRQNKVVATIKAGNQPVGVAFGEGSVWVADQALSTVSRIDPKTNRIVGAPIKVGIQPQAVAFGEGSIWVANYTGGTVSRIDPKSNKVDGKPIIVGPGPTDITTGGGAVWVTCADGIYRIKT